MAMTNAERQRVYRERKKQKERNEKTLHLKAFAQQIIKRPALHYHGGKWLIAEWIIDFFPRHDCYVEPFAGAANVLLRKQPSVLKSVQGMVVLSGYDSDLYCDLYTGWDVVKRESRDINNQSRMEYLWLSPGVYDAVKMPLFNQAR